MPGEIILVEKYERNHWPSIHRPDIYPPHGWDRSLLTSVNRIFNHSLSPAGKSIAFLWNHETLADVYTIPARGGWPARLTTNRKGVQYWREETPRWSPDSQWLACCIAGHVHIIPASGGIPRKISDFTTHAHSPVWMPDSYGLVVSIERHEETSLVLTDREGSWPRCLTGSSGDDWDAQPSPDGKRVAYVHRPLDDLNCLEMRLVDVASGDICLLAGSPRTKEWFPRWSPDGRSIAFLSQRSEFNEIWLAHLEGGTSHQLTHAGCDLGDFAWSPDGSSLVVTVNRNGAFDLGLVNLRDGDLHDLRKGTGIHLHPNLSPDGRFLTVEYQNPRLPPDIYRMKVPLIGAIPDEDVTQLTFSNPPTLVRLPLAMPEPVSYTSFDGLVVHGLLYRPLKPNRAAILRPHGGPREQYGYEWDLYAQYLVARGYTYLAINYRGSTGYGVEFEHANDNNWGIGDTQDCLYGARYLAGLDWIDPQRLAIMGASYGGYMVACCLARDPDYLFACGVSLYGDAGLFSSWAQCERDTRLYTEMMIGHPALNRQVFQAGSPMYEVANVKKPVLILHGLEDLIVPPQTSEEWVEALKREDKTFEYKTYAEESHGFLNRANLDDEYARIECFLDWYLIP
jgi:dipeptidyl aminopeptidase/acylaminoacyl peptidase